MVIRLKKNAFTLMELLAVIVILSLLSIIIVPIVENSINSGKDDLYIAQIDSIKASLKKYSVENLNSKIKNNDDFIYLSLYQLKIANYIGLDITDLRTETLIPNDMLLRVQKKAKSYVYEVLETTGTETTTKKYDTNIPVIEFNPIVYYCNVINQSDPVPSDFTTILNNFTINHGTANNAFYNSDFSKKYSNINEALSDNNDLRVVYSANGAYAILNVLRSGCE